MKKYLDYLSDAIVQFKIVKDTFGKIDIEAIYANKQTEAIINGSIDSLLNKKLTSVFPELLDSIFDWPKILSEAAMTSEHKIIEQYITKFEKFIRFSIFGFKDNTFYIAMQDLTEKKELKRLLLEREREIAHLEKDLKSKANVDMLTNLYNFQFMNESIKSSIKSYAEEGVNFCLLLMDIDNFRKINKFYGTEHADKIIQDIATILSYNSRKIDVVGRYGNDKFMIILNSVDIDIAKIMTEKIKKEIENYSFNLNINLSICGSIVEYAGETIEEFIEKSENLTAKAQSIGMGIILS